jgi:CAAX protease family protein
VNRSLVLSFVASSLAAPVAEEIYFCGYLLPRLSRFGLGAVLANNFLFALFHTWTPWLVPARTIGLIPLIFVAQKKRNIYIGMIAHVLVNTLDLLIAFNVLTFLQ